MDEKTLSALIDGYASEQERKAIEKAKEAEREKQSLIDRIKSLKPRIDVLLRLGAKCHRAGVTLDRTAPAQNRGKREYGYFFADRVSHELGFTDNFKELAIEGGGCCYYDLHTDGDHVDVEGHEELHVLRRFVEEFDRFEGDFFSYVEKKCSQQA